jgi:DNA-binding SARP family transcriptional activator/tetratricopeptide (TPR) repeat protein
VSEEASVGVLLLGPVLARRGRRPVDPGPPRQRAVLAALALNANRVVARAELIDATWGVDPPASAENSIHVYVAGLRRLLEPGRARRAPADVLVSSGPGYLLRLVPEQLDTEVFRGCLDRARQSWSAHDLPAAVASFDAALGLWRGGALGGVPGPFAEIERARLEELRLATIEQRAELMLAVGRPEDLTAELSSLVRAFPLREQLRRLQMLALYACGRQAEALAAFQHGRRVLVEELGVEPGPELQRLHEQILCGRPEISPQPRASAAGGSGDGRPYRIPAQLPHDVAGFTGRDGELARLHAQLPADDADPTGRTLLISTVAGAAGVGKTALAVRFAHQVIGRFGDGQLYVNLHGFDADQPPLSPADALSQLLQGLGVDPRRIPAGIDERAGLYRTLLAGKRVLIVLDNGATTDQVRPLLPGSPLCLVLVTSRNRLGGLVAGHGAHRLTLDVMPPDDAVALLARIAATERVAAEPEAAAELVRLCGYLPLALRLAGDRVASRPQASLAELAEQLAVERDRLDLLTEDGSADSPLRAGFSWSYQAIPTERQRAFRLLALHAGPDLSVGAAAALIDTDPSRARRLLTTLAGEHLVEQEGVDRYRFHDLLRVYAAERATAEESPAVRAAAIRRVLDWYLHTSDNAGRALLPLHPRIPLEPLQAASPPQTFATSLHALRWCDVERRNLIAATAQAAKVGADDIAWKLPATLWDYFNFAHHWEDWLTTHRVGLAATRRLNHRFGEAWMAGGLAVACRHLRRFAEAIGHSELAVARCRELGSRDGECAALVELGNALSDSGRFTEAIAHHEQALAVAREIGHPWCETVSLVSLGTACMGAKDFGAASTHHTRALALAREMNDRWTEAITLNYLGESSRSQGRLADATCHYHQALAIRQDLGDRHGAASTLRVLGATLTEAGDRAAGAVAWHQALRLFEELNDPEAAAVRVSLQPPD